MQEYGWLHWDDFGDMLQVIENPGPRKLRLLACACARLLWNELGKQHLQHTVETAEAFADHQINRQQLRGVLAAVQEQAAAIRERVRQQLLADKGRVPDWASSFEPDWAESVVLGGLDSAPAVRLARSAEKLLKAGTFTPTDLSAFASDAFRPRSGGVGVLTEDERALCRLLRDVFGNPFRPVAFDPAWRTGTAVAIARQMYESRDFGAMPILADALQDAGCDSPDVLDHCRNPEQVHVRGCWVVDLVLGQE